MRVLRYYDKEGGLFVCGVSLMSCQLFNELFPDSTRSCFSQVVLHNMGSDHIYEMRCLFVVVGCPLYSASSLG